MKLGNPWAFGLFFIIATAYLLYINFELPTFFFNQTAQTKAIITQSGLHGGLRGKGFQQGIRYRYKVGDSRYEFAKRLNQRLPAHAIGDELTVKYDIENPKKHEIITYQNSRHSNKMAIYRNVKQGEVREIQIINNLAFFRSASLKKELVEDSICRFNMNADSSLLLSPLFGTEPYFRQLKLQARKLIDLSDSSVYHHTWTKDRTYSLPYNLP